MEWKRMFTVFFVLFFSGGDLPTLSAVEPVSSQVLNYAGKSYPGVQDPEYISYDQALRDYMVKRIKQKFGVELDPKKYSGFDLLEIEAFFECKKSDEPYDLFLKMFPRQR